MYENKIEIHTNLVSSTEMIRYKSRDTPLEITLFVKEFPLLGFLDPKPYF